ncbi:MAG: type I glutamate--ammonia ligase [Thermoplasmata archaeon]
MTVGRGEQSSSFSSMNEFLASTERTDAIGRANDLLKSTGARWVEVHFSDLLGGLRSFTVPAEDLLNEKVWDDGIGFDGSSVKGFAQVEASDMRAVPDPATLVVSPVCGGALTVARALADIFNPATGRRFEADPRRIAQKAMQNLGKAGFDEAWLSPELEFSLFRSRLDALVQNDALNPASSRGSGHLVVFPELIEPHHPSGFRPLPGSAYFASPPLDDTDAFRNDFSSALQDFGIPVKFHHHEGGVTQVEVELKAMPCARMMGDACLTYKFLARLVAAHHGFVPTFMPKPIQADHGNGMHVHVSLWKGGESAFYDPGDEYHMSQTMRYFIGGILEHARGCAVITNPTVNSYKRLVPEYEAPVYIAWSPVNRTALVRIPARHANPGSINCEPRHPDPSANPYLVFAVLLEAGLDGIKRKLDPGPPVNENIFRMSKERRRELGIKRLPGSLGEALEAMESDDIVKRVLGSASYDVYRELKKSEWRAFSNEVTSWEHAMYFNV